MVVGRGADFIIFREIRAHMLMFYDMLVTIMWIMSTFVKTSVNIKFVIPYLWIYDVLMCVFKTRVCKAFPCGVRVDTMRVYPIWCG